MNRLWLLAAFFFFSACTREEVVVQIVRNPLIRFSSDSLSWEADDYSLRNPTEVVQYPADPSLPGRLYTRYTLQATGRDDKGHELQLNLVFDTDVKGRLVGVYRPTYTTERGLAAVQLYSLERNNLSAYSLCLHDTANAYLQVQRQHEKEELISGTFQMTVCNERDTAQKLLISNGILTDVHY